MIALKWIQKLYCLLIMEGELGLRFSKMYSMSAVVIHRLALDANHRTVDFHLAVSGE